MRAFSSAYGILCTRSPDKADVLPIGCSPTYLRTWGLHFGSYTFSATFLLDTLLFIVLLFTVTRQQYLERRRQAQVEMEIKSAREVQHVLIPEDVPAIPGFSIASIYKPATELGGDFYQVIPLEAGGALVVVGDVSGKGLKAAMVVSLIVGTLRTLADFTQQPAEILRGLNRRLIGRTQGGFATCVVDAHRTRWKRRDCDCRSFFAVAGGKRTAP